MRSRLTALIAVIAFAAVTVAAGCGSSNNDNGGTSGGGTLTAASFSVQHDPAIASQVPADVKNSGELTVAADATYAPDEFIASDGKTVIGMDADLAKAIAELMGLKADRPEQPVRQHHPGARRGQVRPRHVLVHGHQGAREDGRLRHLRDRRRRRSSSRRAAGPTSPRSTTSAGTRSAPRRAPPRPMTRRRRDKKCTDAGKPAVSVSVFPDENGVNLALSSGRVDVALRRHAARRRTPSSSRTAQFKLSPAPYRERAVRDRDGQGQRPAAARARRRQGPDGRRHLQEDPRLLGTPERSRSATRPINGAIAASRKGSRWRSAPGAEAEAIRTGTARRDRGGSGPPSRPLDRGGDRPAHRRVPDPLGGRPTTASSGGSSASYLFDSRILDGLRLTIELTVLGDGDRDRPRGDPRPDAALEEPAAEQRQLGLHLVLPRHPAARPDPDLLQHRRALPDDRPWASPSGPRSSTSTATNLITPFFAGMLALGLNEGAYMSEIVRAGIISVDEGQFDAAKAVGMTPGSDDAPRRAPAGDARDHPADRQRDDLDAEEQLAGLRDRREASFCTRPR